MMRIDTMVRKKPKHVIREESFDHKSSCKKRDLLRRIEENDEITNAGIRQAKRKIHMWQLKSQKSLEYAGYILKTFDDQVVKIKKHCDKKINKLQSKKTLTL